MPNFCANSDIFSPAATVQRFSTLQSAFFPATVEILSCADNCTPPPATRPADAGVLIFNTVTVRVDLLPVLAHPFDRWDRQRTTADEDDDWARSLR